MRGDPKSHGLWEASAPPEPNTPSLRGEVECDVAIVGAGYTGLSAALHLAEAGASVRVLEAEEIGFGGSGRNVGLVNAGLWVMPDDILAGLGPLYGERLLDLLAGAPARVFELIEQHRIACEAERAGTLHCAVGANGLDEIEERARQWQARGAPVELLRRNAAADAIGSEAYSGALLDRRAGTIQPLAYARGLAEAAITAGAVIHTQCPVGSVRDDGHSWHIETRAGVARSSFVIVATNAYSNGSFPSVGGELVRLPYFNLATEPLAKDVLHRILPGRQGAWDTREILSSFRLDHAGRLVFGSVGALRGGASVVHASWARRALRRIFPSLGPVRFEHAWYGSIGMTADSLPRLHRLARNMVAFSGYNGRGIGPGTAFGAVLANLALGHIDDDGLPLPLTEIEPVRLRKARELYYEVGAGIAHAASDRFGPNECTVAKA